MTVTVSIKIQTHVNAYRSIFLVLRIVRVDRVRNAKRLCFVSLSTFSPGAGESRIASVIFNTAKISRLPKNSHEHVPSYIAEPSSSPMHRTRARLPIYLDVIRRAATRFTRTTKLRTALVVVCVAVNMAVRAASRLAYARSRFPSTNRRARLTWRADMSTILLSTISPFYNAKCIS